MFKNVASQKIALFAFDTTTGTPKTGDAANITPYVSKDYGTATVLGTTTATEMDATNAKGWYSFVLTQGETNADMCLFTGKSSTANISIVGVLLTTVYASFTSAVAQTGDSYARIGAPVGASISADIAEIEAETDAIQTSTAGLTFTVANQVDANVITKTGFLLAAGGLTGTAYVPPTTALTESYAALHAAPTEAQLLFEIRALLAEKSVASTTLTAKKIDGSTTAETFTLNDATTPTAITRAS